SLASRVLGDSAFAHMERVVCLDARLFSIGFITRHTSKRVLGCRIGQQPIFFSASIWPMRISMSPFQVWFDGCGFNIMRELGFSNWPASPLPLVGLLAHRTCRSAEYIPSSAFRFNDMLLSTIVFRLRVSHCPRGLYSLSLPCFTDIPYAPTRRT